MKHLIALSLLVTPLLAANAQAFKCEVYAGRHQQRQQQQAQAPRPLPFPEQIVIETGLNECISFYSQMVATVRAAPTCFEYRGVYMRLDYFGVPLSSETVMQCQQQQQPQS